MFCISCDSDDVVAIEEADVYVCRDCGSTGDEDDDKFTPHCPDCDANVGREEEPHREGCKRA